MAGGRAGQAVPFKLRYDRRMRRVRLTVTPEDGLVVMAPPGLTREQASAIVTQNLTWVRAAGEQVEQAAARRRAQPPTTLPKTITFPAVQQIWRVVYTFCPGPRRIVWETGDGRLEFRGAVADNRLALSALRRFVRQQAETHLTAQLRALSAEVGLGFQQTRIGLQKTLWGSCSRRGVISLNCKLLFLPPELARHVMIHELAHTRHMNHSSAFWGLVARLDPEHANHRRELRTADRYVPPWLLATR